MCSNYHPCSITVVADDPSLMCRQCYNVIRHSSWLPEAFQPDIPESRKSKQCGNALTSLIPAVLCDDKYPICGYIQAEANALGSPGIN